MRWFPLARAPASVAYELACRDVEAAQRQVLLHHVHVHRRTVFGRQHGFSTIKSVDDFRQRVTVGGFGEVCWYVDRALHGEPDVLVPGRPEFWNATAGTTGYRKLFPITATHLASLLGFLKLWWHGVRQNHPAVADGKVVCFGAPGNMDLAPSGAPIGRLTGVLAERMPAVMARYLAFPAPALGITDPEVRAYVIARCALTQPVSWVVATDSHAIHALFQVLEHHADRLLRDVCEGRLSRHVPPSVGLHLEPALVPQPRMAAEIAHRASMAGRLSPRAAWPDLRLISCWVHGAAAAFLPDIQAAAPGIPVAPPSYGAAEGLFTLPDEDGDVPGTLGVHANFTEFIPVNPWLEPQGEPLLAHELAHQGRYLMVVTTGAGLARYRLDDVVEVDGFHLRAPRLRFVQRASAQLNLHADKTTEMHARTALESASARTGVGAGHWALAVSPVPGPNGRQRYTFILEPPPFPRSLPRDADHQRLAAALDGAMQQVNPRYATARQQGGLDACSISRVPAGAFSRVQMELKRSSHAGDELKTQRVLRETALRELFEVEYELTGSG